MKTIAIPFLYLQLSLVFLFTLSCNQPGKTSQEQDPVTTGMTEPKQQTAMELHDKLMASFGEDWMERESDPGLYPTYYGGSFIDNNGTFVIAVTGNRDANNQSPNVKYVCNMPPIKKFHIGLCITILLSYTYQKNIILCR